MKSCEKNICNFFPIHTSLVPQEIGRQKSPLQLYRQIILCEFKWLDHIPSSGFLILKARNLSQNRKFETCLKTDFFLLYKFQVYSIIPQQL